VLASGPRASTGRIMPGALLIEAVCFAFDSTTPHNLVVLILAPY